MSLPKANVHFQHLFDHIYTYEKGGWSLVWLNPPTKAKNIKASSGLESWKSKIWTSHSQNDESLYLSSCGVAERRFVSYHSRGDWQVGRWVGGWRQKKSRDFNMVLFPSDQVIRYEKNRALFWRKLKKILWTYWICRQSLKQI